MLPRIPRPSIVDDPIQASKALSAAGVNPWVARALARRGVTDPAIARGQYRLMPYPSLKGIREMAILLADAILAREPIIVVADYDCDGATACTVAVSGLRELGADIDFIVPNRFIHGYGLTPSVVDLVRQRAPRWIVTVDNGIASNAGVEAANKAGIGVLVTDHHLPGEVLPDARAIVNPNQPGCQFPSKNLAGCGVMYYVLGAVRDVLKDRHHKPAEAFNMAGLLDVVALGTVADVVKLDENNRWLVRQGLNRIRHGLHRPGIQALFEVANKDPSRAVAQDFGFGLGPRINAAGRLEDMTIGIRCLLSADIEEAIGWAEQLNGLNQQRKDIELGMREAAWERIDISGQQQRFTRVVFDESFHEGVIGIVAGRIKELDHAPTIVFAPAQEEGFIKGSGRSIPGLHLRDALDLVHKRGNDMFSKFGGHAMAAGVTLPADRLDDFQRLFEEVVRELFANERPGKVVPVDDELPADAISLDTAYAVCNEIWGQGFEEPIFSGRFELVSAALIGKDKNHVKMVVEKDGQQWEALHFFSKTLPSGNEVDLAYTLSVNEFRGSQSVNLMVVDRG